MTVGVSIFYLGVWLFNFIVSAGTELVSCENFFAVWFKRSKHGHDLTRAINVFLPCRILTTKSCWTPWKVSHGSHFRFHGDDQSNGKMELVIFIWVNTNFDEFCSIFPSQAPARRLLARCLGLRHRRWSGTVHSVHLQLVGDVQFFAGLPADAQMGRAQCILQEIWVFFSAVVSLKSASDAKK